MRSLVQPARVAALVACLLLATPALAAAGPPPNPYGHGVRYCGSFKSGYRIYVYASHTTCHTAMRIQKEYWRGKRRNKVIVNGGSGAMGYVLLKRYPGWKCTSGSGGGGCSKGRKSAYYQD